MGLPSGERGKAMKVIAGLAAVVQALEGSWATNDRLDEVRELQPRVRELLSMRVDRVQEGTKVAGGESDLIAYNQLVIENKVHRGKTNQPHDVGPNFEWQERRYSISLVASRVGFQVVAYQPADEAGILPMPERVEVRPSSHEGEKRAVVRFVIPFGQGVPSRARAPSKESE